MKKNVNHDTPRFFLDKIEQWVNLILPYANMAPLIFETLGKFLNGIVVSRSELAGLSWN